MCVCVYGMVGVVSECRTVLAGVEGRVRADADGWGETVWSQRLAVGEG